MSDSEGRVKVTDKRMFTAEGELREDYRHLETNEPAPPEPQPDTRADDPVASTASSDADPGTPSPPEAVPRSATDESQWPTNPGFFDLLGTLAEPIALFLGDARLPDGRPTEDLNAARFHIDLLEVIKQKTAGNLSAEESALLEDLLYRLRLRYVQKTS